MQGEESKVVIFMVVEKRLAAVVQPFKTQLHHAERSRPDLFLITHSQGSVGRDFGTRSLAF